MEKIDNAKIKELEKETEEINSQIKALYNKLREKEEQLNQLQTAQSSSEFRKFFEEGAGKYIKVHHHVILEDDDFKDLEFDEYYIGLLGALKLSPTSPFNENEKELVVPIENYVFIDVSIRHSVEKEKNGYFEITEDIFENSNEYSFEFITKEEANRFILENVPKF